MGRGPRPLGGSDEMFERRNGPPDGPPMDEAGPEARERMLGFLREHAPEVADRLTSLQADAPRVFEAVMNRLQPKVRDAMRDARREPAMLAARVGEITAGLHIFDAMAAFHAARKLPEGDAARAEKIAAATEKVKAALGEGFDARLRVQELEVEQLARRLAHMRDGIERQRGERAERLDDMTRQIESGRLPGLMGGRSGDRDSHDRPGGPPGPR